MLILGLQNLNWEAIHPSITYNDEISRRRRPRFSMKLIDRTTSERSESVKLAGTVFGQPEPYIQWYKNGMPIFSDRQKYVITNSHGVAILEIRQLEKADTGEYTCFARNFYGKATSSAILKVLLDTDNHGSRRGSKSWFTHSQEHDTAGLLLPVCFTSLIEGMVEKLV